MLNLPCRPLRFYLANQSTKFKFGRVSSSFLILDSISKVLGLRKGEEEGGKGNRVDEIVAWWRLRHLGFPSKHRPPRDEGLRGRRVVKEGPEVVLTKAMVEVGMEVGGEEDEDATELTAEVGGVGIVVGGVKAVGEAAEGAKVEDLNAGGEAKAELEDKGTGSYEKDQLKGATRSGVALRGRWWDMMIRCSSMADGESLSATPAVEKMHGSAITWGRRAGR